MAGFDLSAYREMFAEEADDLFADIEEILLKADETDELDAEDMNALEFALEIKDKIGAEVTVITMGPPNAAEVLRESLFRGADKVVLVCDRGFAGADTLGTSYTLAKVIQKIGNVQMHR